MRNSNSNKEVKRVMLKGGKVTENGLEEKQGKVKKGRG